MARIPSLNSLWRSWVRSESPRRSLIRWSGADKACLMGVCFAVALLSSWHLLQVPDFTPGMPAPRNEVAPKDAEVPFRETKQQKGAERLQDTIFVQVIDKNQSTILKESLKKKLDKIELLANNSDPDRIAPVNISGIEEKWLLKSSKSRRKEWKKEVELAANRMLKQGLVNTIGFEELREAASLQLEQLGKKESPSRSLGSKLLARTFHRNSNLRQDRSLQGLLEDTINKQTPPIKVKKGDYITRKGELINSQDYFVLNHFNLVPKSPRFIPFIGTFGEALASCGVLLLIMRREKPRLQARHGLLALGLMLTAQISKVWFGTALSPLAVLVPPTLLLSQGLGATSAIAWLAVGSLLWQIPANGVDESRLMVACAVSAVVAFQGGRMRSRAQLLQMAFLLPFGALLGEWFFLRGGEIPNSSDELVYEALVLGGLLMLAILLIPILETTFGLITKARLMELADQERPLLRRLSSEAPGTFEHTLMICGLAEEGARRIGADVDLIRTGSLYHDVGKLHAPEWFIENQTDEVNPHDQLNDPYASANILQAHVDEGLKLARRHGLPGPIADFIPEHQGTLKMGYFLHQARKKDSTVTESRFRYQGPIPSCRETAILMLADGCEAALRSLDPKTTNEEASLTVRKIVESRQLDGQLKESSLTRAEVEIVIQAFVNVWRRMRHRRIPYPIPSTKQSFTA
ncbi:HDIG domain-containing metalloprotein [Prochlorococcus sp. MIT 1307]|uniref:HDIG domain-containing metalloprotein n=1 Tax=Prochlorococcus sp. MIT 1307 TaxID=3096219 RepID=UPI002A74AD1E|nr:HDIG domain-containing metalloprotein [Prochlorococcus sp. MIT 1307]